MVIPHISWNRVSVEDLKHHYETTTQEYSQEEKEFIITLVRMVEEGKLRAFKDPTGEIRYQNDPLTLREESKVTKHIIAFGRAWVCTPKAYKEIQEILLSIYGRASARNL